jgi:acyl-coenzyme A thioesterase PaaI-like protein
MTPTTTATNTKFLRVLSGGDDVEVGSGVRVGVTSGAIVEAEDRIGCAGIE